MSELEKQKKEVRDLDQIYKDFEPFRDRIATVDAEGRRVWIYPKKPAGRFFNLRTIVSLLLLGFLFGAPFITLNGQPLSVSAAIVWPKCQFAPRGI